MEPNWPNHTAVVEPWIDVLHSLAQADNLPASAPLKRHRWIWRFPADHDLPLASKAVQQISVSETIRIAHKVHHLRLNKKYDDAAVTHDRYCTTDGLPSVVVYQKCTLCQTSVASCQSISLTLRH